MAFIWIALRVLLLGYERIAGKKITIGKEGILASWGFFTFSFFMMFPFYHLIELDVFLFSLFSGSIYALSFFLYVYALSVEDTSVIAPLYNMNVVFLIFTTFIFLGENITIPKVVGSLMMIYGVSYLKKDVSLVKSYKNIARSKGAVAMLISSLLMAVGRTIDGHFVKDFSPMSYSVCIYLVVSLYFTFITLVKFKSITKHVNLFKSKSIHLIGGGIANAYAYVALLQAFKYIDVSIAEPVSMLSALVTALMAKYVFEENIKLKVIGTVILIVGAFVIYNG